jgi:DNA-directed RNA polymerase specialized sigma24 family protein
LVDDRFSCVGRSLEPEQQAAIVLREVIDYTNREAADVVGVSEAVSAKRCQRIGVAPPSE